METAFSYNKYSINIPLFLFKTVEDCSEKVKKLTNWKIMKETAMMSKLF